MSRRFRVCGLFSGAVLLAASLQGQTGTTSSRPAVKAGYDADYIGAPLPDPVMQQAKETYVSFGCAYCHGITLLPRGEAADLRRSALVGADTNGEMIVALLRAGVPRTTKLSPMPQFSDLSDRQLHDIARYIHYARQERRYQELVEAQTNTGDAAAGSAYFAQNCAACHAADLAGVGKKYDSTALRAQLLRPGRLNAAQSFTVEALSDSKTAGARQRHGFLLENFAAADVANLVAYLASR